MNGEKDGGSIIQRTTDYSYSMRNSPGGMGGFPADASLPPTEEVIFLEPGEEKAQNIVKAISHQNAGEVVQILSLEGPLRLSDIAERLKISINAAKYHIENLMNAGILEISNTRYSVKGKKVKIYRLKNQVFIVAPKMTSISQVRSALMRYSAILVIFSSVFCVAFVQGYIEPTVNNLVLSGSMGSVASAMYRSNNSIIPALITATAVTLLLLVIYEIHTLWKNQQFSV